MPITRDGVCGDGVDESKSSRNSAAFWMAAISDPSQSTALCDALTVCHIVPDVQGPRTYGGLYGMVPNLRPGGAPGAHHR